MNPDTSAAEAALKAKLSRKRTKTGCLTCRKRRIKCGEEHPVCKNCVKSKRHCEGYSQRVQFRPQPFDFRPVPNGGAHITFQAEPQRGPELQFSQQYGQHSWDPAAESHSAQVQGRPPGPHAPYPPEQGISSEHHGMLAGPPLQFQATMGAQNLPPELQSAPLLYDPSSGEPMPFHAGQQQGIKFEPALDPFQFGVPPPDRHQFDGPSMFTRDEGVPMPAWQSFDPSPTAALGQYGAQLASPVSRRMSTSIPSNHALNHDDPASAWQLNTYTPRPELQRPIDYRPPTPPLHFLNTAAVELQDDDYYDVQSDDDMDIETSLLAVADSARQRKLTQLLERHSIRPQDSQIRRYDTFLHEGILDHYRSEDQANPLRNKATALVFAHFVAVTGPSLSIYERHMRSSSVLFSEGQIPFPQQGLWTYTLPLAALRHRVLLHAMLALASLHIARLQKASETPSVQHYAWAVKRIRQCLGDPNKRLNVTTIAASMLLGFYEIMTADHTKWNMHLTGSKQLFLEIDFGSMVRQFRQRKRERAARQQMAPPYEPFRSRAEQSDDELLDQMYDVDERLISDIAGRNVDYEGHGHVVTPQSSMPPQLDLQKFAMLKDLWWWYCKQDVYQSIISGNPLLLNYSRWQSCPPRAPLGDPDAVYGSVDHLMLLLGRIADFSARDRARKLKQMEVNGGQWRPPPGMQAPQQTGGAPPTPNSAASSGFSARTANFPTPQPPPAPSPAAPAEPTFFGMAPPPREHIPLPASFMPTNGAPLPRVPSPKEITDLQAATQTALEEHGRLRAALFTFESSLGEAFTPLSPEYHQPLATPFGTALFYRSYDIGCLWAIYYMATIVTIRAHPYMHPAAHVAAAIAAQDTAFFANEIGRIVAGIVPILPDQPLNPTLGATLCESCMPSFFAAIQYHDPRQRHATVTRMYDIARRTGWGSIQLIANGCETAWVKAAAAGRGPPYTRIGRPKQSGDPRLNGSWERVDPRSAPDGEDANDRRLVRVKPDARLQWAIGVMGTEDDVMMAGG